MSFMMGIVLSELHYGLKLPILSIRSMMYIKYPLSAGTDHGHVHL